jgi:hypothetical protein
VHLTKPVVRLPMALMQSRQPLLVLQSMVQGHEGEVGFQFRMGSQQLFHNRGQRANLGCRPEAGQHALNLPNTREKVACSRAMASATCIGQSPNVLHPAGVARAAAVDYRANPVCSCPFSFALGAFLNVSSRAAALGGRLMALPSTCSFIVRSRECGCCATDLDMG